MLTTLNRTKGAAPSAGIILSLVAAGLPATTAAAQDPLRAPKAAGLDAASAIADAFERELLKSPVSNLDGHPKSPVFVSSSQPAIIGTFPVRGDIRAAFQAAQDKVSASPGSTIWFQSEKLTFEQLARDGLAAISGDETAAFSVISNDGLKCIVAQGLISSREIAFDPAVAPGREIPLGSGNWTPATDSPVPYLAMSRLSVEPDFVGSQRIAALAASAGLPPGSVIITSEEARKLQEIQNLPAAPLPRWQYDTTAKKFFEMQFARGSNKGRSIGNNNYALIGEVEGQLSLYQDPPITLEKKGEMMKFLNDLGDALVARSRSTEEARRNLESQIAEKERQIREKQDKIDNLKIGGGILHGLVGVLGGHLAGDTLRKEKRALEAERDASSGAMEGHKRALELLGNAQRDLGPLKQGLDQVPGAPQRILGPLAVRFYVGRSSTDASKISVFAPTEWSKRQARIDQAEEVARSLSAVSLDRRLEVASFLERVGEGNYTKVELMEFLDRLGKGLDEESMPLLQRGLKRRAESVPEGDRARWNEAARILADDKARLDQDTSPRAVKYPRPALTPSSLTEVEVVRVILEEKFLTLSARTGAR